MGGGTNNYINTHTDSIVILLKFFLNMNSLLKVIFF